MPSRKPSATKDYKPKTYRLFYHLRYQQRYDRMVYACLKTARTGKEFPSFPQSAFDRLDKALGPSVPAGTVEECLRTAYNSELMKLGSTKFTITYDPRFRWWRPLVMTPAAISKRRTRARQRRQSGQSEASRIEYRGLVAALKYLPPSALISRRAEAKLTGDWAIHSI